MIHNVSKRESSHVEVKWWQWVREDNLTFILKTFSPRNLSPCSRFPYGRESTHKIFYSLSFGKWYIFTYLLLSFRLGVSPSCVWKVNGSWQWIPPSGNSVAKCALRVWRRLKWGVPWCIWMRTPSSPAPPFLLCLLATKMWVALLQDRPFPPCYSSIWSCPPWIENLSQDKPLSFQLSMLGIVSQGWGGD